MQEGLELEKSAWMGRRILPKRLSFTSRCRLSKERMYSLRETMLWMLLCGRCSDGTCLRR
ncbi:MAG: hypothetical protein LBB17_00010 [Puniceicoccales bacterium]|nr:hypothetical protein [Puniceicoccales bacterium]